MQTNWLDEIQWDGNGLVPVVTQEIRSKRILTHAWVNREALECADAEGQAVYWSRSRGRLWRKGEQSGHVQKLHGIYLDCDGDTICYQVEQVGGIACHTGRESCFYQRLGKNGWQVEEPVLKDPESMYGNTPNAEGSR